MAPILHIANVWHTNIWIIISIATKGSNELVSGGFQLLDLIITELKSHMTCYNSMPLIG